jgi:two-component system response regulator
MEEKKPPVPPLEILLVEDDETYALMARREFEKSSLAVNLSVAKDGEEALQFLRREGVFANAPRADLVLLDLNLPKKSGREVLAELKGDKRLSLVPVVTLTASPDTRDIAAAYGVSYREGTSKIGWLKELIKVLEKQPG